MAMAKLRAFWIGLPRWVPWLSTLLAVPLAWSKPGVVNQLFGKTADMSTSSQPALQPDTSGRADGGISPTGASMRDRSSRVIGWMNAAAAALVAATTVSAAVAQVSRQNERSLQASGRFVDTTIGIWEMHEQPMFARKPELSEFLRAARGDATADFSVSFNCAVRGSGVLADCRPVFASPASVDKAALVRAIAPLIRLTRADAALARAKVYRLTMDVALDTTDRYGMPKECRPPFCMIEGAVPPPPPPPLQDPVIAAALGRARTCFDAAWQRSTALRFAAERALRDRRARPATDEDRRLVLDYVNSRHALAACMTNLAATARVLPLGSSDAASVKSAIGGMRMSYDGQARYELAILIGLLDPASAEVEASIP